ncbi:hypothetical protein Cgig2_029938 [Carnegiea gigantea]|uniref:Uncharacterized protein n=1 Tax=Carnegiea gigantea TaxID=171969 RepID=A0A9Q1GXN6_9CARY|nr:hypothetical protein Cgig2_029938 [Carnegiea gigantea]
MKHLTLLMRPRVGQFKMISRILQDDDDLEELEDEEPVFVMTDEWREFFAKSEARRQEVSNGVEFRSQPKNWPRNKGRSKGRTWALPMQNLNLCEWKSLSSPHFEHITQVMDKYRRYAQFNMGVTSKLKTFVHQLLMVITGVEPATVFPVNRRFVKQDKGTTSQSRQSNDWQLTPFHSESSCRSQRELAESDVDPFFNVIHHVVVEI